MYDQNQKLKEIINSEKIDMGLAMNILFNAISANWENFNKIDKQKNIYIFEKASALFYLLFIAF